MGPGVVGGRVLIQITPHMRILVAIESIDGRKGIDSIAQLCREKLAADPFSGCLFIFRNRSGKVSFREGCVRRPAVAFRARIRQAHPCRIPERLLSDRTTDEALSLAS